MKLDTEMRVGGNEENKKKKEGVDYRMGFNSQAEK